MKLRYQFRVTGRVQRVSFRAHTVRKASELELTGRATNLKDGSVEVFAQGSQEQLDALHAWLRKGPLFARVDSVTWTKVEILDETELGFTRH